MVFALVLAAAFAVLLAIGRYRWFTHDEWDYLAGRDGGDLWNVLIPHNEHWSTLPILTYRVLFRFVGLHSYLPYRVVLLALHLTAAALLRVVMRRAGVGPWIATGAALSLVFFGSGSENILWAVQIGFIGALVLGLAQLLLADHDGPVDHRDWLGLLAGFAGLLCSSVALTMVGVVGLATLVRRGWRPAVLHTAPLVAVYAIWFRAFQDETTAQGVGYTHYAVSSPQEVARFVATGVSAAFDGIGQVPGVGWVLGIILVVGLFLAWRRLDGAERRARLAMPAALLTGAFVSLCITGIARAAAFGSEFARTGRYLYVFVALSLPALGVAADAVARRWSFLAPVDRSCRSRPRIEGSYSPCRACPPRMRCRARRDRSSSSRSRSPSGGSSTELRRVASQSPRTSRRSARRPPRCTSRSISNLTCSARRPAGTRQRRSRSSSRRNNRSGSTASSASCTSMRQVSDPER